jgi:hypothetical protein
MLKLKNMAIILFFLAISNLAFSQDNHELNEISTKVSKIVSDIAKGDGIDSSSVGIVGVRTERYDNFTKLVELATRKELMVLTDHTNVAVRGYAFWALSFDHSIDLLPIIKKHLSDDEYVGYTVGCNANSSKIGDFFINIVSPKFSMNPVGKDININKFTSEQQKKLDHLLLNTPNDLKAKYHLFSRLEPTLDIYSRVRMIVIDEKDPVAAVLLAKYKKDLDVPIILTAIQKPFDKYVGFGYSIQAIQEFPHPNFFPVLKMALESKLSSRRDITGWSDELIRVIVSYHNHNAVELLQSIFMLKERDYDRKAYLKRMVNAISYSLHPVYKGLLWKLWREEQLLTQTGFEYLLEKHPDKTFSYAQEFFYNSDNEGLASEFINFLLSKDKDAASNFIRGNIVNKTGERSISFYIDKVAELQNKKLMEAILENQLDPYESDNPEIVLHAAKVLLAYKDEEIKKKVIVQINKMITRIKERKLLPYETFLMEVD